ncbi:YaiO family outer membrane beta-barrel protein [Psychroflexus salinarum]|uniref:YaiO family outer membrane beta-barrel protein n=1 Tax=Psychroflexus salinarum TaxID=546024 RepID=A0ABW3GPP4_9FLAO
MKNIFKFKILWFVLISGIIGQTNVFGQEINVDSLLYETIDLLKEKEYEQVKINAQKALKIAPDYLDYNLVLGRAQEMTGEIDKARLNYEIVINQNKDYKTAFYYLFNLEFQAENYKRAKEVSEMGIEYHPDEDNFYYKKLSTFQPLGDLKGEYTYIKEIQPRFPDNKDLEGRRVNLELRFNFDIAGVNYSFTTFDRENFGPWHLLNFQYIHQRKWGSLIGRVNYANRLTAGGDDRDGLQYELESFFFTGKNSYSFVGGSYSSDEVFPTWRLRLSHFMYFNKGWGGDIGARYDQTFDDREFYTAALGINKYIGSYWIYLRSFLMTEDENKYYPAFTLITRYYIDTRFDYLALNLSYGTNPDERSVLGQFQRRVSTESYRINLGYFRMINQKYLVGIQAGFNNQEYLPNRFQNEYELFVSFQYKLN